MARTGRREPTLADVQAVIDRRGPGGITISDPVWLAAFQINERKVADYRGRPRVPRRRRGPHPQPGRGPGHEHGHAGRLQPRLEARAGLAAARAAPEPLLASYSIERSAVGRQVLAAAGRITALAVLRGAVLQSVRNHVASLIFGLAPVRRAMANTLTELSIGYPREPAYRAPADATRPALLRGARAPVSAGVDLVRCRQHASICVVRSGRRRRRRVYRTASRSTRAGHADHRSMQTASGWCDPTAMSPW